MDDDDSPIAMTEISKEDDSSLTEEDLSKKEKIHVLTCRPLCNTLLVSPEMSVKMRTPTLGKDASIVPQQVAHYANPRQQSKE